MTAFAEGRRAADMLNGRLRTLPRLMGLAPAARRPADRF